MKFYIWGDGPTTNEVIRAGEPNEAAEEAAIANGFKWGADSWAIEVEAQEEDVDAATRFDHGVAGWCEAPVAKGAKKQ